MDVIYEIADAIREVEGADQVRIHPDTYNSLLQQMSKYEFGLSEYEKAGTIHGLRLVMDSSIDGLIVEKKPKKASVVLSVTLDNGRFIEHAIYVKDDQVDMESLKRALYSIDRYIELKGTDQTDMDKEPKDIKRGII